MAEDKRISELSPIPTVTPGALFPVVDEITGETMSARFDQMAATVDLDDYALKTYVDAQDIATLDDAKDYADLQDVTNLNAAKAYADGLVVGLWDDRGNFNASVNAYPSSGGSGTAGAIKKGDIWTVSVAGILPSSQSVEVGDTVRALVDTPGNTQANWSIQQNNIGYTAENSANKTNTVTGNEASTTLYASVKGFVDYLVGMTWLTSTIFGAWIVGNTAKSTPVGGDSILISDLSDSNKTKKTTLTELWTNYLRAFVFATSLTSNRILYWDGNKLVDSRFQRNTDDSINYLGTGGVNFIQFNDGGQLIQGGKLTVVSSSFSGLDITGRIINRNSDSYAYQITNGSSNFYFGLGGTNTGVFRTVSNICMSVNDNGVAIGTGSVNSACALDIQSTTKGAGLPLLSNATITGVTARNGNIFANSTNGCPTYDNGTSKVDIALKTDIFRPIQFAPLSALVSTVAFNRVTATGAMPSTSASGTTTTYQVIDGEFINLAGTISKVSIRLTQACTDQATVGSNPTVRIDLYKSTSISRTLIATYRVAITQTAGIGTSSTLGTLTTGIDTTYELTGLSSALAVGDLIGAEFVPESGTTKIVGVTNLTVIFTQKLS